MEFKGTKGKWVAKMDEMNVGGVFCDTIVERAKAKNVNYEELGEICQCWADCYDGEILPESEMKANALLISKAPEILKMLNQSKDVIKAFNIHHTLIQEIEKLIKEATEL